MFLPLNILTMVLYVVFFSFLLPVISFRFAPFCLSLFVGFWSLSVTLEAFLPSGGAWMLVLMKSQSPGQCP